MTSRPSRRVALTAAGLITLLTGCGLSGESLDSGGGGAQACSTEAPQSGPIKVGSADFPESGLIAEIYAGALKAKGIDATTTDPIGAREAYLQALQDGSVQVVPEYTNSLLNYLDPKAKVKGAEEIHAALQTTVPCSQLVLQKSAAEDSNALVVSQPTAKKWNLKTVSDLAKRANEVSIAASPEFRTRQQGLVGLKSVYNLEPKSFRAIGNAATLAASLKNGQVTAANIYSTDPSITTNKFVVLKDDKQLFGSDNVVPLVARSSATPQVQTTLNAVSAKLTTPELARMLKEVVVDKKSPAKVAEAWLSKNALS
ncbi:ABC transporter substrate-binding protein [Demetria terragena]|uniref:ABC transporter substrate-binding protein n=1 Tax=Demetria terragena TaxID=63959 RepID=UPI00037820C7|nr:ABC transporter substrate-binding protein [Demetria terragena]